MKNLEQAQKGNSYIYQGKYITRARLKSMPDTLLLWKKNKLYTTEQDDEGSQIVKRYKVNWKI